MSRLVRVLACCLSLLLGCAASSRAASTQLADQRTISRLEASADGRVSLEFEPSASAAALLPLGARYRVAIASPEEVALVVVTPDRRISGRMRIHSIAGSFTDLGSTIIVDDFAGPPATISAWSAAGEVWGEAAVGAHEACWQARLAGDGSLAGRRWSGRRDGRSSELLELRRARAIGSDLAGIWAELGRRGVLDVETERELGELITLVELALDLSVRAWEGHGRARLPTVDAGAIAG